MNESVESRRVLRRVLSLHRPYLRRMVPVGVLMAIAVGGQVCVPLLYRLIFDVGWQSGLDVLAGLGLITAAVLAGSRFLRIGVYSWGRRVGTTIVRQLRDDVFGHLLAKVALEYHEQVLEAGEAHTLVSVDINSIENELNNAWLTILEDVFMFALSITALISVQPLLTLGLALVLPGLVFWARRLARHARHLSREERAVGRRLAAKMEDLHVHVLTLVRLYGLEGLLRAAFGVDSGEIRRLRLERFKAEQTRNAAILLFGSLTTLAVYVIFGVRLFGWPRLSVGSVIAYGALVTQLVDPLQDLLGKVSDIAEALPHFERLFQTLDEPELPLANGQTSLDAVTDAIVLDGVTFTYERAAQPVLRNVTARFPSRQWHVLAGLTGSGKSTVFGVLTGQRRLDPIPERIAGRVLIDGHELTTLTTSSQVRLFALVLQDPEPRGEALIDKLLADSPTATNQYRQLNPDPDARDLVVPQLVQRAVRIACMTDVVDRHGYRYKGRLSGGQRHRVAIAAAIIRILAGDALVLLLDEAISNLDPETALNVRDSVHTWAHENGITVIEITHRFPQTTADSITIMHDGEVQEHGTHAQLITAEGRYQQFVHDAIS